MPFLPLRALPLGNSRFVVFLVGLLLGALLLNLHLGRSYSVSGSGRGGGFTTLLGGGSPRPGTGLHRPPPAADHLRRAASAPAVQFR